VTKWSHNDRAWTTSSRPSPTPAAASCWTAFNETIHTDWKPGSEWYSTGPEGKRDVDGKVLECDPPRRLVITWHVLFDPELSNEISTVTYLIEKRGELCKLSVRHDLADAPKTAGQVNSDGWQWILSNLKTPLETGQPLPAQN